VYHLVTITDASSYANAHGRGACMCCACGAAESINSDDPSLHHTHLLRSPPCAATHQIPSATLKTVDLQDVSIEELCTGKKVVLFAVPGAFTPTCSKDHAPGFLKQAKEFKAKGVDLIMCVWMCSAWRGCCCCGCVRWGEDNAVNSRSNPRQHANAPIRNPPLPHARPTPFHPAASPSTTHL